MKKFLKEFKAFISRGNVLDMAVGVIIGGAFTAIVNAFTNNIIRPLINWVIKLIIGDSSISAYTFLDKVMTDEGTIDMTASIYIDWGAFISAIINFLLVALVLFLIIKAINAAHNASKFAVDLKAKKEKGIRLTKREEKKLAKILEEEAKVAAEEARKAEEEKAKAAMPSKEEALLMEIRDLLAKK